MKTDSENTVARCVLLVLGLAAFCGCSEDPADVTTLDRGVQAPADEPHADNSRNDSSEVSEDTLPETGSGGEWTPQRVASDHLPNALRITDNVISGGQPDGEAAFRELRDLGVKTIISVDGAQPNLEFAKKYGLRYVHLPHGYDGVPRHRGLELAKAVRELPGPIYIHCHHGKHRSPAAAVVACVGSGSLKPEQAPLVLKAAGTSPNYRGLFESAESAQCFDDSALDHLPVSFPEQAELPPMAQAMVAIEHLHDHLKEFEQNNWRTPARHPDLDPRHEALLLREQFTELLRTEEVMKQPEPFQQLLRDSEAQSRILEDNLRAWRDQTQSAEPVPKPIREAFARISAGCKSCHQQFRDVPLREKAVEVKPPE